LADVYKKCTIKHGYRVFLKGSLWFCSKIFRQCQLPAVSVFEKKSGTLPEFMLTTAGKNLQANWPFIWKQQLQHHILEKLHLSVTSQNIIIRATMLGIC